MNWLTFLTRSKGIWHLFRRIHSIASRYGVTTQQMTRTLELLNETLETYQCSGTFPITAIALGRHPEVIQPLAKRGLEFAVHGYVHVDHSQLSPEVQQEQLAQALQIFEKSNIPCQGFRSPYLHWNTGTLAAIKRQALLYESNQPILWDVLDGQPLNPTNETAYQRAIEFYTAWPAAHYLALPRLVDNLVRIPVALPDDEMLVDRAGFSDPELISKPWQSILRQTYERGELFTLSLHPERTAVCHAALIRVLTEAREQQPAIWIARLQEISEWWRCRQQVELQITPLAGDEYELRVQGPARLTLLARYLEGDIATEPWFAPYSLITVTEGKIRCPHRPVIGVAAGASPDLVVFLRQLGYPVEVSHRSTDYALYFDQQEFTEADEKPLIDLIEKSPTPLVRIGLWPDGARSALAITGDIDALTIWDYVLRLFGA